MLTNYLEYSAQKRCTAAITTKTRERHTVAFYKLSDYVMLGLILRSQ